MVAFTLLLLIGVAALALDLAAVWNERRQDQTASDLSAIAGALSYDDDDAMVEEAMATARVNVDTQFSDADWTALWTSCTDPDRPADFTPIDHSTLGTMDCISLSASQFRVRLPDQLVDTSFSRIWGVDSLTASADTIVTLGSDGGVGALPFAIRGNAGSGEVCLDTSTGSKIVPPCDGNESGSFGNIGPPLFGNPDLGTSPECQHQTSANNHVAESIAMGIDHDIDEFTPDDWYATGWDPDDNTSKNSVDAVANMDECIDTGNPIADFADGDPINAVYVDTGNSTKKDITEGMVTGTGYQDGEDARLTRTGDPRDVDGYSLDNQPLWQHLISDGGAAESGTVDYGTSWAPSSCDPSLFVGESIGDKNDQMRECLEDYEGGGHSGQIFANSILDSPRVGKAPRLWHNNLGSGLSYRPVKSFDIVYINALHFDDKDETAFYPNDEDGSAITMKKWKDVEQVTAFLLLDSMVSTKVQAELGINSSGIVEPTIYE